MKDWCEFFKKIEKDPAAKITGLTVRDYFAAKLHVQECKDCEARTERVVNNKPNSNNTDRSLN